MSFIQERKDVNVTSVVRILFNVQNLSFMREPTRDRDPINEISVIVVPLRLQKFMFIRESTQGKVAINECDMDFREKGNAHL